MSAREILAELSHLTPAELQSVEKRFAELRLHSSVRVQTGLRLERAGGRLVLASERVIQQADVEAILDDFP